MEVHSKHTWQTPQWNQQQVQGLGIQCQYYRWQACLLGGNIQGQIGIKAITSEQVFEEYVWRKYCWIEYLNARPGDRYELRERAKGYCRDQQITVIYLSLNHSHEDIIVEVVNQTLPFLPVSKPNS